MNTIQIVISKSEVKFSDIKIGDFFIFSKDSSNKPYMKTEDGVVNLQTGELKKIPIEPNISDLDCYPAKIDLKLKSIHRADINPAEIPIDGATAGSVIHINRDISLWHGNMSIDCVSEGNFYVNTSGRIFIVSYVGNNLFTSYELGIGERRDFLKNKADGKLYTGEIVVYI